MYKILYLTQFPEIGGGETILLSLLEKLDKKKFKPYVIVPKRGQLSERLAKINIETYLLDLPPYLIRTFFVPGASPVAIYRLARLAKIIKPDLIHINHLTLSIYAGSAAKLLKIPVVATAHGPWDSYYFYQDLISNLFVDKILANTQTTANNLTKRKITKRQKIEIIPFGIDTDKFKPLSEKQKLTARKRLGFTPNDFIVTIVGRLDPAKDHLTFLKAAQIIQKKLKNSRFFIVGSKLGDFSKDNGDYFRKLKSFLTKNPTLARKVVFGGFIEDMPAVYNSSDVLVSTSPSESFGLAQAEAASSGLPIIATQNLKVLAKKILFLAKSPQERRKIGASGRSFVVKNFNIKNYIQNLENNYLSLLKKSPSAKNRSH